jgi:predicted nucleotide-binding protein/uncharacterized protein YjbI with pentapeptide repeats
VYDKSGIAEFGAALSRLGIDMIATSGTAASLQAAGQRAVGVNQMTAVPHAFLGGRTKTMQPAIYAGLLADRDNAEHMDHLERHGFLPIDLVCLNLHPFGHSDQDETRASTAISHIDIGGPMLLRAAALNHRHVAVVTRPGQYADVIAVLEANDNQLPEGLLTRLAGQAFAVVASYEAQVSAWFSERLEEIAEDERQGPLRFNWKRCAECAGAIAASSVAQCLRHVEPSVRRRLLEQLEGEVDLRNVQVTPTLMQEILRSVPHRGGRPMLANLRADWAQFEGRIDLQRAHVSGDVDLGGARFSNGFSCEGVSIDGEFRCRDTRFRDTSFAGVRVHRLATFRNADFGDCVFDGAVFSHQAIFEGAHFAGRSSFRGVTFGSNVSFMAAVFRGQSTFTATEWRGSGKFRDAKFEHPPVSDDVERFHEATWPDETRSESTEPAGHSALAPILAKPAATSRVFIASSAEQLPVAQAIQINLDHEAEPHVWTQGFEPGSITTAAIVSELRKADFAVFVLGGEDRAVMREEQMTVARDNVILELGLSAGLLGLERTFLIKPRRLKMHLPTDILGITILDFDELRDDKLSALGAACNRILTVIRDNGPRNG